MPSFPFDYLFIYTTQPLSAEVAGMEREREGEREREQRLGRSDCRLSHEPGENKDPIAIQTVKLEAEPVAVRLR